MCIAGVTASVTVPRLQSNQETSPFLIFQNCLQAEQDKNFAKNAMSAMEGACPTSLCLTLHHYAQVHADTQSQGPLTSIHSLMKQEYCGATRMVSRHDFLDGVRAMMVDKDKSPKWDPNDLSEISDEELTSVLEPMPKDLELAWKEQVLL